VSGTDVFSLIGRADTDGVFTVNSLKEPQLIVGSSPTLFEGFCMKCVNLLWRSSCDGCTPQVFHHRCDSRVNTLSFTLSLAFWRTLLCVLSLTSRTKVERANHFNRWKNCPCSQITPSKGKCQRSAKLHTRNGTRIEQWIMFPVNRSISHQLVFQQEDK
jgi:hypothetical protein